MQVLVSEWARELNQVRWRFLFATLALIITTITDQNELNKDYRNVQKKFSFYWKKASIEYTCRRSIKYSLFGLYTPGVSQLRTYKPEHDLCTSDISWLDATRCNFVKQINWDPTIIAFHKIQE